MRIPLTLVSCAGLAAAVIAQPTFTLIQPDPGFDYTVVQDVAKHAPIVLVSLQNSRQGPAPLFGYTLRLDSSIRADITDPFGSDLNPLAISDRGEIVVGYIGGGPLVDVNAVVWDAADGELSDIFGLPTGNLNYATGVSADGSVVVGTSATNFGDPYSQGWRWTRDAGFTPLLDIGDDELLFGTAEDVSGDGLTVVGTGSLGDFDPDTDDLASAVLWSGGSDLPTDLGNLPSPIATGGTLPTAASHDGSVVVGFGPGFAPNGSFANRGFRWTSDAGLVDIGGLPDRPNASIHISDCSSDGNTLVGYSIAGGVNTWEAIVWTQATGVRTLRSILAERGVTIPATIALRETYCNADASIIAGWAYDTTISKYRGYVVTLPTECPADFNADGFADFFDFTAFVECFEGGECPPGKSADFNADGFVDFFDFQDFTDAFDSGC